MAGRTFFPRNQGHYFHYPYLSSSSPSSSSFMLHKNCVDLDDCNISAFLRLDAASSSSYLTLMLLIGGAIGVLLPLFVIYVLSSRPLTGGEEPSAVVLRPRLFVVLSPPPTTIILAGSPKTKKLPHPHHRLQRSDSWLTGHARHTQQYQSFFGGGGDRDDSSRGGSNASSEEEEEGAASQQQDEVVLKGDRIEVDSSGGLVLRRKWASGGMRGRSARDEDEGMKLERHGPPFAASGGMKTTSSQE